MARLSEHAYLSIGDVLDLLKDEFPEITISKIRFLEAQGLIDPERTPSGYRKFYQQDLARLRWILIQQRDHFLPLKVIRDRLEAGAVPDAELAEAGAVFPGAWSFVNGETEVAHRDAEALPSTASDGWQTAHNGHGVSGSEPADVVGESQPHLEVHPEPRLGEFADAEVSPPAEVAAPAEPSLPFDSAPQPSEPAAEPTPAPALSDADADADAADRKPAAPDLVAPQPAAPAPEFDELAATADRENLSGVSLTVSELAAAASMTVAEVRELEKFGLLAGDRVGPEVFYDETALQIAELAGRFRRHGIEPRHLRQYRVNTDREMSLFEQVVAPYVRQRGRMGHSQASASMRELSDLGEGLRRALLKRAARDYLGES